MNKDKINTDIHNLCNVGKILIAEKDLVKAYIKNRKPVLDREQKDNMGLQLNNLGNALLVVIHHFEGRVKELTKILDEKTEEVKSEEVKTDETKKEI